MWFSSTLTIFSSPAYYFSAEKPNWGWKMSNIANCKGYLKISGVINFSFLASACQGDIVGSVSLLLWLPRVLQRLCQTGLYRAHCRASCSGVCSIKVQQFDLIEVQLLNLWSIFFFLDSIQTPQFLGQPRFLEAAWQMFYIAVYNN